MATKRPALTKAEFISKLVAAGVREETANFVWDEAVYHYTEPLKPDPSDFWEGTMRIDPEDLEDITAKFWNEHGWVEPSPQNPVVLPANPSLLEFAKWLDLQRKLHQ